MLAALGDTCMGAADRDVVETSALNDASSASASANVSFQVTTAPALAPETRPKKGPWDRLKARMNDLQDMAAEESPQDKAAGLASVLKQAVNKSELLKLAEEKQQQLDEEMGVTEGSFYRGRHERVDDSTREAWHSSFRSKRRSSISVNPAMLQALQTVQKQQESTIKQATAVQASLLLEGRVAAVPMDKKGSMRSRRLSGGHEALLSNVSLTNIWAKCGTHDDKFRPENNAVCSEPDSLACTSTLTLLSLCIPPHIGWFCCTDSARCDHRRLGSS